MMFGGWWSRLGRGAANPGRAERDPRPGRSTSRPLDLSALDPGRRDRGYWPRFQSRVSSAVLPELARRRAAQASVPDVLRAWSRLLVPGAALAAALGAFLVTDATDSAPIPSGAEVSVEREDGLLPGEEVEEAVPSFLAFERTMDDDVVRFAIEGF